MSEIERSPAEHRMASSQCVAESEWCHLRYLLLTTMISSVYFSETWQKNGTSSYSLLLLFIGQNFLGAGGWCFVIITSLMSHLTVIFYAAFDAIFSLLIFLCVKTILSCSSAQIPCVCYSLSLLQNFQGNRQLEILRLVPRVQTFDPNIAGPYTIMSH